MSNSKRCKTAEESHSELDPGGTNPAKKAKIGTDFEKQAPSRSPEGFEPLSRYRSIKKLQSEEIDLGQFGWPGTPVHDRDQSLRHGSQSDQVSRTLRSSSSQSERLSRAADHSSLRRLIREVLEKADRTIIEIPSLSIIHATANVGRSLQPHRIQEVASEILLTCKEYRKWTKGFYVVQHPDCGGWIAIGGNHRAYVSKKVRGFVSAAKIDNDGMIKILRKMQKCETDGCNPDWDTVALRHICTEIDNQGAFDDCRSLSDEVRRFKQDAMEGFPSDSDRLRLDSKLGIHMLSKTVVEFFNVVWNRPVIVGGDRLSKCVPEAETFQPINLPVSLSKAYDRMASRDRLSRIFSGLNRLASTPGLVEVLDDFPADLNRNRNNEARLYIFGTMKNADFKKLAIHVLKLSREDRAKFDIWNIAARARRSKLCFLSGKPKNQKRKNTSNDQATAQGSNSVINQAKGKEKKDNDNNGTKKRKPWESELPEDDVDPETLNLPRRNSKSLESKSEKEIELDNNSSIVVDSSNLTKSKNPDPVIGDANVDNSQLSAGSSKGQFTEIAKVRPTSLAKKQPRINFPRHSNSSPTISERSTATKSSLPDPTSPSKDESRLVPTQPNDNLEKQAVSPKSKTEPTDTVTQNDQTPLSNVAEIPDLDCTPDDNYEYLVETAIQRIPEAHDIRTLLNFIPPHIRSEAVHVSVNIVERTAKAIAKNEINKSQRLETLCSEKDDRIKELKEFTGVQADIIQSLKDDLSKMKNELHELAESQVKYHGSERCEQKEDEIYRLTTPPLEQEKNED